ncbi:putative leucine-rich repeat receptor-like serine/threonine-protein kinase [Iris pallida]|uniref:non-specific serine/threonine protein kinase n=1 Tax=Iris pallida TaxID=29817 RepID=A0AAX6E2K3_IRIPA|nr:putative leucine-rich repeat receptor-like serine/threonine-protein kinase [Iris pallida]
MSRPHNNFTDLESLLAFKASVADPHGLLATNWTANASFCSWNGVRCSHRRQRVVALKLANFFLGGSISPHIANLSFLSRLNLSHNALTGPIPGAIGRLPRLARLSLAYNSLSGPIPLSIFNMSSLVEVSLLMNNLSGSLPSNTDPPFMLPWLQIMSLSKNHLTGSITPNFARCSQLQVLSLSFNNFGGSIPPELGNITGLILLYLGANQLTGSIPASIGKLSKLNELELGNNYLQGVIPEELGNLLDVQYLALANNILTGSIPIALLNASKIHTLILAQNNLIRSIPATLGVSWPQLEILDIRTNKLTGRLDFINSLSNCRNLEYLELSENKISDFLPDSLGNLSTSLKNLYLNRNYIKGRIPSTIGNLSGLIDLDLGRNELIGEIPSEFSRLKSLQGMFLDHNRLSGYIPPELGLMTGLNALALQENAFSGTIPHSLGNISGLQSLSLAANGLFSSIPDSLWSLSGLLLLNLSGNTLDGSLPQQMGNLKFFDMLDLSKNRFSGNISSVLGNLQMITYLDLSNNSFDGQIPSSLDLLVINIEYMNLSYNRISGTIPESFTSLGKLYSLDLSFNKLQGPIPEGGVFSNSSTVSLEGNPALCGALKLGFSPCPPPSNSKSNLYLLKYILPPIVLVVLLLSCFCTRLIFHRWDKKQKLPSEDTSMDTIRVISYRELVRATDNFSEANLVGRGSFSSVYKAHLDDGLITAIKVMNSENQSALRSFDAEYYALSKIRHRNLVRIISMCSNLDFKALVLQFMPNGSLEQWLHSHNYYLNLLQRINIMVDVSLAFEYLHHYHPHVVVHRDLKPSNVLLDENMTAHVSDFGISKLFLGDSHSILSATAPGTLGYMAPEYGSTGKVSRKGDVYSFGILLLESFTRKKPTDAMFDGELSLRQWVTRAYPSAVLEIVDPDLLKESVDIQREPSSPIIVGQCLSSLIELGLSCSRDSPQERIQMRDVVPKLQKIKNDFLSKSPRS